MEGPPSLSASKWPTPESAYRSDVSYLGFFVRCQFVTIHQSRSLSVARLVGYKPEFFLYSDRIGNNAPRIREVLILTAGYVLTFCHYKFFNQYNDIQTVADVDGDKLGLI